MSDTTYPPPGRRVSAAAALPIGVTRREAPDRRRRRPSLSHSRTVVMLSGVPSSIVDRVESHGRVDWRPLASEFERLSIVSGGQRGLKRFLSTPHIALQWRTPLEALDEPAAIATLVELANERVVAKRHARVSRAAF